MSAPSPEPTPMDPGPRIAAEPGQPREQDARMAHHVVGHVETEAARNAQRDGAPVIEGEEAPRPRAYHDPTPMAPGPDHQ